MKDFNYCIWFLPEGNHEWYNYTNGYKPHMTIKSKINKSEIYEYNDLLKLMDQYKIKVKLINKLYQTKLNYFYSLQYDIEICDEKQPKWWPNNAHISFRYKYNLPFSDKQINELDKQIKVKEAYLDKIQIYNCIGDFSTWKSLTITS